MKWKPGYSWRFRWEQLKYNSKPYFRKFFRFSVTVVCSALLAIYLQPRLPRWKKQAKAFAYTQMQLRPMTGSLAPSAAAPVAPVQPTVALKGQALATPPQDSWSKELNDFYSKYLEEVMRALRADKNIRIVKLDVPHSILNYQRNLATMEKGGQSLKLQAKSTIIPVVAVSRNSKSFLEEMRVTYVDPQTLPIRMIQTASFGMPPAMLNNYLLIPDLSGKNAKKFVFGNR